MVQRRERSSRKRICFVAASPITINAFMLGHIAELSKDYDVFVISNFSDQDLVSFPYSGVECISLPIQRSISLYQDIRALFLLFLILAKKNFFAVHSITPKAGLLTAVAARFAFVPNRIHWFTGQVWATKRGFSRFLLRFLDSLTAKLSTVVLVDSPSQLAFLEREHVVRASKGLVLGKGSVCGVNSSRFIRSNAKRAKVRLELGIGENEKVILFLGRLNREKGVLDLAHAFLRLRTMHELNNVRLLIVGPDEEGIASEIGRIFQDCKSAVSFVGFTKEPESYMAASDIFCLPSYREGFGSAVLEAASCGVPSVVSRIYGLTDAVIERETGLFFPAGDIEGLVEALLLLCENEAMRLALGNSARANVERFFSQDVLISALKDFYRGLPSR